MSNAREHSSNFKTQFRRFVGRPGERKPWTVKTLADTTGISERTISSYYGGDTEPCWAKMLVIADALGPQFMNALLAPVAMGGVHLIEETAAEPLSQMADMARSLSALSDAMEDGIIDHVECRRLAPLIQDHGVTCIQFAASLTNGNVKPMKARAS